MTQEQAGKIISWNVNGIRACLKGGFTDLLTREQPDVVALQEVRAAENIASNLALKGAFSGYKAFWHCASKAGYSGTALLVREGVAGNIVCGMDVPEYDSEGRVIRLETDAFTLVNLYAPHSGHELARLDFKQGFARNVNAFLNKLRERGKPLIVTGDLNVAHHAIDLANPKANRNNAGFLPEERAWLDGWQAGGMVDAFRHFTPHENGHYTWWSQRSGVRERNIGWRIDAFWVDNILTPHLTRCFHLPEQHGSDHCPVGLEGAF